MQSIWLVHLGFGKEQPKIVTVNSYETACKVVKDFLYECFKRQDHEWSTVEQLDIDEIISYSMAFELATVRLEQSQVITMRN